MSLHLGNLSSRVRRDELECVFRRFGRCNVQLKDGFGFVVYDFPSNAEKALGTLRGKNICREPITLSWSNRQPGPFQRFSRGNRSYEMQNGRSSERGEDYINRKLVSKGQQDNIVGFKHVDSDGERLKSTGMVDEATNNLQDDVKEYIEENVQNNLMDNERWGERVGVPSNEIVVEGGLEFDRYEPYHDDDDKRDEDANQKVTHSGISPNLRKSRDKVGREQMGEVALKRPDVPKSHQTCYICGELGHKMHSCPQENMSQRKKLTGFDRRCSDDRNRTGRSEGDIERVASKSRGRLHSSRDTVLMRRQKNYGKESRPREHRRLIRSGNSKLTEETHKGTWRKDYLKKKRRRRDDLTPERCAKKARGPVSSPIHSDYTASRSISHSESSHSVTRSASHSKSRSVSSRPCSPSSRSRFGSTSQHSGSGSSKSRSRSKSSCPTLSVSVGRPLTSSPNKTQMNQKGSLVDGTCPESKEVLVEQAQPIEGDAGLDNYKLDNTTVPAENNNAIAAFQVVEYTQRDHPSRSDDNSHGSISKVSQVKNSSTPLLEKGDVTFESLSPESLGEIKDIQNADILLTEQTLAPNNRLVSETFVREHLPAPKEKPDPEFSVRSRSANPTFMSSEELHMVLKHYGLDPPVENEKDLPVEAYFGTARLWPWEIICYRRLRNGPISTENYARRIAQNQEFGIVDRYVRSSSGWGELDQQNF